MTPHNSEVRRPPADTKENSETLYRKLQEVFTVPEIRAAYKALKGALIFSPQDQNLIQASEKLRIALFEDKR